MLRDCGRAKNKTAIARGDPKRTRHRTKNAPAEFIYEPRRFDVRPRTRHQLQFPAWTDACGPGGCEWLTRPERGEQCPADSCDPKIGPPLRSCSCGDMGRFAQGQLGRTKLRR